MRSTEYNGGFVASFDQLLETLRVMNFIPYALIRSSGDDTVGKTQ
jgi:hypothetical protein